MASEFFLLASLVLIGIVFFSVFQIYTITQSEETKKAEIKAEAERIASLAYKISKDPSKYMQYCLFTLLSNITVENGLLRYESSKYKFTLIVPKEIENSQIFETTKVCFVKRDNKIVLSREAESCNLNGVCELEECKVNCPDCYGPNNNCLNDNFCNLNVGENCKNSLDCSCRAFGQNYVCCPENPSSNKYGCLYLSKKKGKGEECYCDDECSSGLKCNPVDPSFTSYKKACCEEGKVWNGKECVAKKIPKVYHLIFVPLNWGANDLEQFKQIASIVFNGWLRGPSPFKTCPDPSSRVEMDIVDPKDCQMNCYGNENCLTVTAICATRHPHSTQDYVAVGLCKNNCLGLSACGVGAFGGPSVTEVVESECSSAFGSELYKVAYHEMGHSWMLGHTSVPRIYPCWGVDCSPPPWIGSSDCNLPFEIKKESVMAYCTIMSRYLPEGYKHLTSVIFKDYLEGCNVNNYP